MKKIRRKLVGLITFMPFTLLGILLVDFIIYPKELLAGKCLEHVQAVTLLWIIGLLIYYFFHLFRETVFDGEKRILWAVALLVGNVVTMPIYWYRHIWQANYHKKRYHHDDGTPIIGF